VKQHMMREKDGTRREIIERAGGLRRHFNKEEIVRERVLS